MSETHNFTLATAAQFLKYAGYDNWMHIPGNKLVYVAETAAKRYPSLYVPWCAALRLGLVPEALSPADVFAPHYEVADDYTPTV